METTKSQKKKQPTLAKRWCFTLNNPDEFDTLSPDLVEYSVVGHEIAASGTHHLQGFVIFKNEKRLTAVSKLLPRAHWEIARGSNKQASEYCKKDKKYVECGSLPEFGKKRKQDEVATSALSAPTVSEGMTILAKELPFEYLKHGESMERNLKKRKVEPYRELYPLQSFSMAKIQFGKKATLIWGPSGTGKTCFALAHFKNPLVVSHIDKLKQLSPDHDGIVFDDMSFKHWPIESVIHLLDYEITRDINVRYGTVNIPAKITKVFTHNTSNPFYDEANVDDAQKEAIERRLSRVHVLGSLININYKAPPEVISISDSEDEYDADIIYYGIDEKDHRDNKKKTSSTEELLRCFDEEYSVRRRLFPPTQSHEQSLSREDSDESSEI